MSLHVNYSVFKGVVRLSAKEKENLIFAMAVSLYVAVGGECCWYLSSEEQGIRLKSPLVIRAKRSIWYIFIYVVNHC